MLKQLGRKALKRALGVYQNLLKKAKYKKLPKILDSNIFCRKKLLEKTVVKL